MLKSILFSNIRWLQIASSPLRHAIAIRDSIPFVNIRWQHIAYIHMRQAIVKRDSIPFINIRWQRIASGYCDKIYEVG